MHTDELLEVLPDYKQEFELDSAEERAVSDRFM